MDTAQTTFLVLGALFVLVGWVVFLVVRRAYRKRRSIFGVKPVLRCISCGALFAAACFQFYMCAAAISSGQILVVFGGRYAHGSGSAVYQASNPGGFWEAICANCYLGLVLLYVFVGEVAIFIKQSRNVKPKSSA